MEVRTGLVRVFTDLMKSESLFPRWVSLAFSPRQIWRASRISDFPDFLGPVIMFTFLITNDRAMLFSSESVGTDAAWKRLDLHNPNPDPPWDLINLIIV